jgi:hypothetical protein
MKNAFLFRNGARLMAVAGLTYFAIACNAQSIKMPPPPVKAVPAQYLKASNEAVPAGQANAYDLTQSLPAGYVKDGSVDYTAALQKGITANKDVVFPDFPVQVSTAGLSFKSDTKVYFKQNSAVVMMPNNATSYAVLRLQKVNNVTLFNPKVVGDRKNHSGTTGEWGMGISLKGCSNIRIQNPDVSECWGDGIYLGSATDGINKNIVITNARLNYNRRNGISITNVDGLTLTRPVISNTMGASPMAGIDVEPNSNGDFVDNITIDDPVTFNNGRFGIVVSLGQLPGDVAKDVNITINNHVDDGSTVGFCTSLGSPKDRAAKALTGNLQVNNPDWRNSRQQAFMNFKVYNNGLNVNYKGVRNNAAVRQMRTDLGTDRRVQINQ